MSAGSTRRISLPLDREAAVNVWLLLGEPLSLVDTGPVSDAALAALEDGLARDGIRLEQLELVLVTHQHPDHSGLAATIRRRSGATVAALAALADYLERFGAHVAAERAFFHGFLAEHGVPARLLDAGYWGWLEASHEECSPDVRLAEGDVVRAGGRDLRVVHRPGHSELDTLFVDDAGRVAFVGDHLLTEPSYAEIGPTPGGGRTRPLGRYLANLRRLAGEDPGLLLPGHGPDVADHRAAVAARLEVAAERCDRIEALLDERPADAFELAERLWSPRRAAYDPVLAVSDVVGHLDLLVDAGHALEVETDAGPRYARARVRTSRSGTAEPPR